MIINLIKKIKPNEIYNLAAQSHVAVSFQIPEYTANVDALGCLRILEAIKLCGLIKKQNFIRLVHLKCLERLWIYHKQKNKYFILEVLTVCQKFLRIGLQ